MFDPNFNLYFKRMFIYFSRKVIFHCYPHLQPQIRLEFPTKPFYSLHQFLHRKNQIIKLVNLRIHQLYKSLKIPILNLNLYPGNIIAFFIAFFMAFIEFFIAIIAFLLQRPTFGWFSIRIFPTASNS